MWPGTARPQHGPGGVLVLAQEADGPSEDAAWRGVIRDVLCAVACEYDGNQDAAAGALAVALNELVSGERLAVLGSR